MQSVTKKETITIYFNTPPNLISEALLIISLILPFIMPLFAGLLLSIVTIGAGIFLSKKSLKMQNSELHFSNMELKQ